MDEVNINKYLAQFNPILVVPVLSAVVGAILVFVFGFKRQNEPRFTTASAIDSIKKSKRKSTNGKNTENAASAKVNSTKKANSNNTAFTEISTLATGKKTAAANEKAVNNNMNKKKDEKKSEEKRSDLGSPSKKMVNAKKTNKESNVNSKKLKVNKKSSEEHDKKPADFDDDGWFTVTKKQQKIKNEIDGNGNKIENPSPKQQSSKANNNNKSKNSKADNKVAEQSANATTNRSPNEVPAVVQSVAESEVKEVKQNGTEPSVEDAQFETVVVNKDVIVVEPISDQPIEDKQSPKPIPSLVAVNNPNANTDSAIAFDELGEWTDAKPDRKKGNKKKSRKDQ